MKINKKTVIIIAGALVVLGIILAIIAVSIGGLNMNLLGAGKYDEKTYTYDSAKVKKLIVRDVSYDVVLAGSSENEIRVKCYESDDDFYRIDISEDGRLTIERDIKRKWYNFFNFDLDTIKRNLIVTVPSGLVADADIVTVSGNLTFSNLDNLGSLYGKTTSGNVRLEKVSASGNTLVNSASGSIRLASVKTGGKLEIRATSGEIKADLCDITGDLIASTVTGGISGSSTNVRGNVKAECVSGDIRIDRLSGADFSLRSTSGNIKGIISGNSNDYKIESHTTSGKIDLPRSQNGSRLLSVSTISGNIDLDIRSAS